MSAYDGSADITPIVDLVGAIIRLQQDRIRLHLMEKGDKALTVDRMVIDDQNFHGFLLSAGPLALRKVFRRPTLVLGPSEDPHLIYFESEQ